MYYNRTLKVVSSEWQTNMCMLSDNLGTMPHVLLYTPMVSISTKLTH